MVDIIAPSPETQWYVDIFLIICTLIFAIIAIVNAALRGYIVTSISMILCTIFAMMFLVSKGWGRQ